MWVLWTAIILTVLVLFVFAIAPAMLSSQISRREEQAALDAWMKAKFPPSNPEEEEAA